MAILLEEFQLEQDLKKVGLLKRTGFKTSINQLKNVELKENAHRLQKKVALDEQKR